MSRSSDDSFLEALLGADPDAAEPAPSPVRTAPAPADTVETPAAPAPSQATPEESTAAPKVDLSPAPSREPAYAGAEPAPARRPGSYEPVLPVPDDPTVVQELKARAGVADAEPKLAGFLEGLLGIITDEPVDARGRLIEAYSEQGGSAEQVAEVPEDVQTDDVQSEDVPTEAEEPVTADAEQPGAVQEAPAEGAAEDALPPLSHDGTGDVDVVGPAEDELATEEEPMWLFETAPAPVNDSDGAAPAAEQPATPAAPATAPAADATSELIRSLTSFDVGRRRTALISLLERPLDRELATAAASSLRDPESEIRLLALQVLERAPNLAPLDALDLAMLDPDAEIRRRATALVGHTGDLELLPHLQDRLRDETDEDVLAAGVTAISDLFRVAGERASAADLDRVSATVGQLRPAALPQLGRELTVLAQALDAGEIRHRLGEVDEPVRVGAAVLALESGTEESLRALSRLVTDGSGRVRQLALAAVARLRSEGHEAPGPAAPAGPSRGEGSTDAQPGMSRAVADEVQGALLPGLFEALTDPKQEIRDQARNALTLMDRSRLVAHIEEQAAQAGAEELVRLVVATRRLSIDEAVPALAAAAVRHSSSRTAPQLAEALRDVPAVVELLERWRRSDDPEDRSDAVRLAALVGPDATSAALGGLSDPNPNVRLVGIETAHGRIDDRLAAALLGIIEGDPSTRVQVAALEAFSDAPSYERVAAARAASGSPVAEVRRTGLRLLAPEASEDFNQLAAALRDDDPSVVQTAATALSSCEAPEATALLWSEIRGAAGDIRHLMLEVLHAEQPQALSRLARRAVESMDPAERAAGLSALSLLGDSTVRDQVIAALGDPSVDVRLEALRALAVDPAAVGTSPLAAVMRDADPRVRAQAVDVIAGTEDEDALPLLVRALDDPAEAVRLATRRALGRVRSPAAVDLLLEALGRPAHRAAAVDALAALGQPATGRLVRALATTTGEVRDAVREALLRSGAVERTVRSLRDPSPSRRRAALTLLRAVRPEGVAIVVAERLEDPDPDVRQAAAQLLGELDDRSIVPALQHAFVNDPDMGVVEAVEVAYRRLGGGETN